MRKSTKSVLAAGAAVVVLTGGAGSLAYWNATADVEGGQVEAGELALDAVGTGVWELNGTAVDDPDTDVVLVPGDVLTYTADYTVVAVGNNIQATLSAVGGDGSGTLAPFVETELTATDAAGDPVTTIGGGDNNSTLNVDLEIDFPFGAAVDNDSQEQVLDLSGVSIVLTQTDATP
ncbi:alternate-type signal peptide domain-containing protein [uncultured Nocardioides sp.]|uniref:alternate-type signal peptide domain-containing protein n=1 Tax=uncultured Nocardioides sp. TaxID=198441 RepID=UPI002625A1F7|nr:alternate-type signal peptide domain-containing protein [uncultured Nocardioides sp.]